MAHTSSLKIANQLLQAGKLDDARKEYKTLIELRPNFPWSYYYLGQLLAQENKWPDAIANYKRAIELNPNSPHLHNSLAEALIKQGELDEAIHSSKKAISIEPSLAIYHQTLALAYEAKSDFGQALTTWQKILYLNPSHLRATQKISWLQTDVARDLVESGDKLNQEGKIEEAVEFYQQALILNPPQPMPVYLNCGNNLITLGRFEEAETIFQQLKELYPEQPDGYERLAKLTHSFGDWELALKRWSEAVVKFPPKIGFQVKKGNLLIKLSRFDEAEAVFQQLIEKYPELPSGYEGYARLTHSFGDWELALKRWSEAIVKFPENIGFQLEKGNVLINLSRFDEAEAVFQGLKEKYPEQPEGYSGYAELTHHLPHWKLALKRWNEAIAKFPDNIDFQVHYGNALINLSRFDKAEAVFQGLKEKYPERPQGYEGYAGLTHHLLDWELALQRWEEAIAKFPYHFNFYLQKGDVLANLFQYEEAETWWEKVIAQYPDRHQALLKSAALARQLGNHEFAWERFEQIIEKFPWYLRAYCEAAKELIAMGRFAEAEEKFLLALQRNPKDLNALLQGGILASQQGYRELALERFERVIEFYSPQKAIDAYILAAVELKYLGREGEAIAKYEQILSFHQQRGLYPEVKLLGTSLTSVQELGLLLDRLVTKQPDSVEDVVSLAKLTDEILFSRKGYAACVDKDAPSLVPKLKILKELFGQVVATQEDCKEQYLLVLKHFNMAIQLLEKESERLNSSEWGRIKLLRTEIPLPLMDELCFEGLSSSGRYVIGTDERVAKSQVQATVKYLPELMDEEKEYFADRSRKFASPLKLKSRQTIEIFKDFICQPPFGFSEGYIFNRYSQRVSEKFVKELINENTSSSMEIVSEDQINSRMVDTRRTLDEIAIRKTALDNYYEDDVIFGLPVFGNIWGAYQNYGHLLWDQIPSLILYQKLNLSCKIFVPHITDSHWEIFNALNIPKEKILVKQEQKFKYFIITHYKTDVSMIHFYQSLRESILAKHLNIPSEFTASHIYVSRRYSKRRQMANEVEVEKLMASLGFSIVYLERLSFEETALLMHHASMIVAPFGASVPSFTLCRARTTLVIIFPPDTQIIPDIYGIPVLAEHQFYPLSGDKISNGWQMNIDKLEKVVSKLLEGQVNN
jgi:tetratricopeptide (TPR) repeat protein